MGIKKKIHNSQRVEQGNYFKRFITLFDAVVAIIITVLVLDIRVSPSNFNGYDGIKSVLLMLFFYGVSFYIIALYWNIHHRTIFDIKEAPVGFVNLNFLFLFALSLFPIACIFLNASISNGNQNSTFVSFANIFYSIVILLVGGIQMLLIGYMIQYHKIFIFKNEHYPLERIKAYNMFLQWKFIASFIPLTFAIFTPELTFIVIIFNSLIVNEYLRRKFLKKIMLAHV